MKLNLPSLKKPLYLLQFIMIAVWVSNLAGTDAYFSVYALCGVISAVCLFDNYSHDLRMEKGIRIWGIFLSVLFSVAVVMANYALFAIVRNPKEISSGTNMILNLFNALCTLIGGYVAAENVLCWVLGRFPRAKRISPADQPGKHPGRIFWGTFLIISLINLAYHFFVSYPGVLTLDSIHQIQQIRDGVYSNHHPFWHTMVIKLFLEIGYAIFGDINRAVAVYTVAQILIMAACFGYVLMTLCQAGVPKVWMVASFAIYALMPYNIVYSNVMWKDILFGGAVCVFLTAMYRILKGIGGKQLWNYVVFAGSGLGFCLWRSNGFLAILAAFLVFLLVLRKDHKKLLIVMFAVLVTGWVMKGPVLSAMHVTDPDLVESLSIPVQQVARVITDGCELTQEETELLENVVDIEEVPKLYNSGISDNIKNEIRSKDNAYFEENIGQYLKLWLQLLVRYPGEYVKAWIDQTKGYWGGGYPNWIYGEFINENDMGIAMSERSNILFRLFKMYSTFSRNVIFFEPLHSIGLHVWVLAIVCFLNLVKKRREWLLAVPLLAMVLTLMVATPVYAEFRYAYAIFTACPLVVPVSLYGERDLKK